MTLDELIEELQRLRTQVDGHWKVQITNRGIGGSETLEILCIKRTASQLPIIKIHAI